MLQVIEGEKKLIALYHLLHVNRHRSLAPPAYVSSTEPVQREKCKQ